MTEAGLVDIVHSVAFLLFWFFLVVGAVSTIGRAAYYRAHGFRRPTLLTRDAVFVSGFALSFGLILAARALDVANLRNSLLWALATDIPAIIAVSVFVYYELAVIERGRDPDLPRPDEVAPPDPNA